MRAQPHQLRYNSRISAHIAATDYAGGGKTPANLSSKNRNTAATTTPTDTTSRLPTNSRQYDALGTNARVSFQLSQMAIQQQADQDGRRITPHLDYGASDFGHLEPDVCMESTAGRVHPMDSMPNAAIETGPSFIRHVDLSADC